MKRVFITKSQRFLLPLKLQSIDSLLRHIHLQHVKKRMYKIRANISSYIHKYTRDGKSIVALSKEANFPPYMMARLFVEHMHVRYDGNSKGKGGNKKYVTDAMRDPKKILSDDDIETILRPEYLSSESNDVCKGDSAPEPSPWYVNSYLFRFGSYPWVRN